MAFAWLLSAALLCNGTREVELGARDASGVVSPMPRLLPAAAGVVPRAGVGVTPRGKLPVLVPNLARLAVELFEAAARECFCPTEGAGVVPRGGIVDFDRCTMNMNKRNSLIQRHR